MENFSSKGKNPHRLIFYIKYFIFTFFCILIKFSFRRLDMMLLNYFSSWKYCILMSRKKNKHSWGKFKNIEYLEKFGFEAYLSLSSRVQYLTPWMHYVLNETSPYIKVKEHEQNIKAEELFVLINISEN